jgi:hypothetical protein
MTCIRQLSGRGPTNGLVRRGVLPLPQVPSTSVAETSSSAKISEISHPSLSTCPPAAQDFQVFVASGYNCDDRINPDAILPLRRPCSHSEGAAQAALYGMSERTHAGMYADGAAAAESGILDAKDFSDYDEVGTNLPDFGLLDEASLPNFSVADLNVESSSLGGMLPSSQAAQMMRTSQHNQLPLGEARVESFELAAASAFLEDVDEVGESSSDSSTGPVLEFKGCSASIVPAPAHAVRSTCNAHAPPALRRAAPADKGTKPAIQKWKKRDSAKHLAGERKRRANRMGKLSQLSSLLPHIVGTRPTVNHILSCAVERIKQLSSSSDLVSCNK